MPRFMDNLGLGPEPGRLEVRRPDSKHIEIFYVPLEKRSLRCTARRFQTTLGC